MNANSPLDPDSLAERVTQLETLFTHLQRTLQDLNEAVIGQGKQFDVLASRLSQVADHVESMADNVTEKRNLLDEKPPHY